MTKQRYLTLIAEHFPDITYNKVRFIRRGWDNGYDTSPLRSLSRIDKAGGDSTIQPIVAALAAAADRYLAESFPPFAVVVSPSLRR